MARSAAKTLDSTVFWDKLRLPQQLGSSFCKSPIQSTQLKVSVGIAWYLTLFRLHFVFETTRGIVEHWQRATNWRQSGIIASAASASFEIKCLRVKMKWWHQIANFTQFRSIDIVICPTYLKFSRTTQRYEYFGGWKRSESRYDEE